MVSSCDLALAALLLLANDFSVHTQVENAAVELDRVLDPLEVLVDALHALDLAHVRTHTLGVFADGVDLLL